MTDYIPGHGNDEAKLLIIGDSPNPNERRALDRNYELDRILKECGIPEGDVWKTNVSKHYVMPSPKGKKIPFHIRAKTSGVDLEQEMAELRVEIASIKPNCILALGSAALFNTAGQHKIGNYRGSILWGSGSKVVGTYDPRGLSSFTDTEFKGYWNRQVILFDTQRAWRQSEFPELRRPFRMLQICKSSYQLQDFLNRYKNHTKPAIDIEARGKCLPACVGIAFTPEHGITVPLWNGGEYESVIQIPDSEMVQMWLVLSRFLAETKVVGQNLKYDQDKLLRLGFTFGGVASDTLLKSFAINSELPKSLGFLTSVCTEEPFYKDEGMYEGALKDLFEGCARDCCVTKEIDLALDIELDQTNTREYFENFILDLHQFYLDVDNEGMNIDSGKRLELFEKYVVWSEALSYELATIVGETININSPAQVNSLLYANFRIPQRKGTGEDVITDILNTQSIKLSDDKRRALEIILEQRRVEKTISTYLSAFPDFDGKMRTSYFPCLDTGRSSTGQLDPPTRPDVEIVAEGTFTGKKQKKKKPLGIAFQTMTKHGDIGQDVRGMYVPDKGHVFIQGDSAQAEARVVFLLAEDYQALKDIDEHDYHALTASWFFGGTENDYSKKVIGYEHPIRFVGKTLRHAGHLGAGKGRAAAEVNTNARKFKINVKITEAEAGRHLNTFHDKQPKIRGIFHEGVKKALSDNFGVIYAAVPYGINSRLGGRRQFFERWGDELFRLSFSYIPQRSVSDNTKAAGLRIRKREPKLARLIIEAHDSLMYMIPEREVDSFAPLMKEELQRPIRFDTCTLPRQDLIIPAEIEVGYNYMEFEKYKILAPPIIQEPKKVSFYG
jgi:DNA polymerase I-like protein with 3'-5' exonuclease and polymerase domains/uracil-DNA glycosylase